MERAFLVRPDSFVRHLLLEGRILIDSDKFMELTFEKARELYGDRWLGFTENDLHRWLEAAGFRKLEISVVAREEQPPNFQTILAAGEK